MIAMDISSATSSLFSSASRYGEAKKNNDGVSAFLDILSGGQAGDLSSLQAQSQEIDGLPVEKQTKPDGLPVEPTPQIDGLPVEPSDPYVDPQILLTQKLAASLMGGVWWTIDPPSAAAA
jgi:hypothetical protein